MKKIGVVLPETLIDPTTSKRYENLKDFQNVQWLQEAILESQPLRKKYWPDESNLFVVTVIGGKGSIRHINGKFLIEHFNSKEELKAALAKIWWTIMLINDYYMNDQYKYIKFRTLKKIVLRSGMRKWLISWLLFFIKLWTLFWWLKYFWFGQQHFC